MLFIVTEFAIKGLRSVALKVKVNTEVLVAKLKLEVAIDTTGGVLSIVNSCVMSYKSES